MPTMTDVQRPESVRKLSARMERFDSFWEGPKDIQKGYRTLGRFYEVNYLPHMPNDRSARTLVISCGPGYFVDLLVNKGYTDVVGIDSDPEKVEHAVRRGLNCRPGTAFETLRSAERPFDVIVCEQELNHLTKDEMVEFLRLVWDKLGPAGRLLCHGLNGGNPIVGAEALAQNFDHFNTFTSYSMKQVLEYCGFTDVNVFGLNLYVFHLNPFNYVAAAGSGLLTLVFRALFVLYGKSNKIFTKKIGAVALKPA